MDDLPVSQFHAKERSAEGVTYRWLRDESRVTILTAVPDVSTLDVSDDRDLGVMVDRVELR